MLRLADRDPERHPALLDGDTTAHYREVVAQGAERVASAISRTDRPFSGVTPGELETTIARIDLDAPLHDVEAALDEIERIYLRDAVYFHHPRYLAHLNCPVAIPALLAIGFIPAAWQARIKDAGVATPSAAVTAQGSTARPEEGSSAPGPNTDAPAAAEEPVAAPPTDAPAAAEEPASHG